VVRSGRRFEASVVHIMVLQAQNDKHRCRSTLGRFSMDYVYVQMHLTPNSAVSMRQAGC